MEYSYGDGSLWGKLPSKRNLRHIPGEGLHGGELHWPRPTYQHNMVIWIIIQITYIMMNPRLITTDGTTYYLKLNHSGTTWCEMGLVWGEMNIGDYTLKHVILSQPCKQACILFHGQNRRLVINILKEAYLTIAESISSVLLDCSMCWWTASLLMPLPQLIPTFSILQRCLWRHSSHWC